MDETKNKKVFFRLSKRGKHLYGYIPAGGAEEGDVVIIPVSTTKVGEQTFPGVIAVIKGQSYFTGASILAKDEEEEEE